MPRDSRFSLPLTYREAPASFEEVLARHLHSLYAAALRMCRSASEAEDLVQEASLRAYRGFKHLRSERKAKAWLLSILVNQWLNRRRGEKRRPRFADLPLEEALCENATAGRTASTELGLELREAFDSLEEEFRVVVWLADAEGFTTREIARMLRLPQGTVASRLFRGRKRLRALLGRA